MLVSLVVASAWAQQGFWVRWMRIDLWRQAGQTFLPGELAVGHHLQMQMHLPQALLPKIQLGYEVGAAHPTSLQDKKRFECSASAMKRERDNGRCLVWRWEW